jgi:hypothetical protein
VAVSATINDPPTPLGKFEVSIRSSSTPTVY